MYRHTGHILSGTENLENLKMWSSSVFIDVKNQISNHLHHAPDCSRLASAQSTDDVLY